MKKIIVITFCYLFIAPFMTMAGNSNLFYYNEQQIEREFKQLQELENYVLLNNITLNNLLKSHNPILNKTDITKENLTTPLHSLFIIKEDMDWASFAWGLCCWPVGCLIVPFNKNKNDAEKLSFFYGMLTNNIIGGIYQIYVVYSIGTFN